MKNEKKVKKDVSRMTNSINLAGIIALLDIIYMFIFKGLGPTDQLINEELRYPKYKFKDFIKSLIFALIFLTIFYFWFHITNK